MIANSNEKEDQYIKEKIAANLRKNLKTLTFTPKEINSTRQQIKETIPTFRETIEKTLKEVNSEATYTINYGQNYFPEKEYKGVKYPAGEYESLVVTIGDGLGENFWCILFPPLCLLDGEETKTEEIEYTSFIKEIIDKYF